MNLLKFVNSNNKNPPRIRVVFLRNFKAISVFLRIFMLDVGGSKKNLCVIILNTTRAEQCDHVLRNLLTKIIFVVKFSRSFCVRVA